MERYRKCYVDPVKEVCAKSNERTESKGRCHGAIITESGGKEGK